MPLKDVFFIVIYLKKENLLFKKQVDSSIFFNFID